MKFNDFFNDFNYSANKNRDYDILSLVISKVVEKYIKDQEKPAYIEYREVIESYNNKRKVRYHDVFAPEGFDSYIGPTSVDIKILKDKKIIMPVLRNTIKNVYDSSEVKNYIFVLTFEITSSEKEKTLHILNSIIRENLEINMSNEHKQIFIWDIQDLNFIFEKYRDYYQSLLNNANGLLLNDTVQKGLREKTAEDKSLNNQEYIDDLKRSYKSDDLVLFVGAGISKDAGIAMWDTLIYKLLVSLVNKGLKKQNAELSEDEQTLVIESIKKDNGNSPLQLVRFIRHGLQEEFQEILSEILYKDSKTSSQTLKAITNLCTPVRNGIGVQGVVTYNFDDLLEKNFESNGIAYLPVYKESEFPSKNEIGIFHVHGFLPNNKDRYDGLDQSLLVFSEEGYHSLLNDPYHWANLIQLNYLRERTCLFIGVSLTDPNVRRLLEINMNKQPDNTCRHYLILKKEKLEKPNEKVPINMKNIEKFQEVNQVLKEDSLKELGINVIWIEDYDIDIPNIISEIKKGL